MTNGAAQMGYPTVGGIQNNNGHLPSNQFRGDNSISNGQLSHQSAVSNQMNNANNGSAPANSGQRQGSMGGPSTANGPQHQMQYQGVGPFQAFNSSGNEASYKFASAGHQFQGQPGGSLSGERPMSRGNNGPQAKLSSQQPQMAFQAQQQQQPNQAFQIHQDQQNFHLPPGAFNPANPTMIGGGGAGQPQYHFIANKQKFYAQITPDKAPLLFSEKRPYTAANPINLGNNLPQSVPGTTILGNHQSNSQPAGKRGNSHNAKQRQLQQQQDQQVPQLQQINHLTTSGIQPPQQIYTNPYHLSLASKTHTGAFGAQGLQQMMINPLGSATMSSKFGVSSTGQLETHSSAQGGISNQVSNGSSGNQLVSIFNPPGQGGSTVSTMGKPLKVKPPNRNNIKEKEQLYEDAIKLKIQVNSYREENVRLKTKIKILENDMSKQERAMEEFISKFQAGGSQVGMSLASPLIGSASTGSQSSASSQQQQNGVNTTNLNIMKGYDQNSSANNHHMISIMSQVSTSMKPFLQQNETFLVMSLKKQLKELKTETLKKDEELEQFRKSIKNTRQLEIDTEIKTYIDECQRLRQLLQTMLQDGPQHPLYQERMQQLEQQRQQNEFLIAQLTQQNQELLHAVQIKEEEIGVKQGARKEMKQELVKARKTLRDREKELAKLRLEVSSNKKANGLVYQPENNSFSTKEANGEKTAQKSNNEQNSQINAGDKDGTQAQAQVQQTQLKNLQKKVRDLTNDTRAKKQQIESLEQTIKNLQENIKQKEIELTQEHKKIKVLEDDLAKAKKGMIQENEMRSKFSKELEAISLIGQRERISHVGLCKKLKEDTSSILKGILDIPSALKDFFSQNSLDLIARLLPYYFVLNEDLTQKLLTDAFSQLKKLGVKTLKEKFENDDIVSFDKFQLFLKNKHFLTDHLDLIKAKYLEIKQQQQPQTASKQPATKGTTALTTSSVQICLNLKKIIEDLDNASSTIEDQDQNKEQKSTLKTTNNLKALTSKKTTPQHLKNLKSKDQVGSASKKQTALIVADIIDDDDDQDVNDDNNDKKKGQQKDEEDYEEDFVEGDQINKSGKKERSPKKGESNKKEEIEDGQEKKEEELEEKKEAKKKEFDGKDPGKYMDEEEMLDVAEACFIKMAESLIDRGRTARSIFTKYSIPEQFPDGTILELLSPIGFLEGVKEAAGIDDLSEMEAACLLRVLAKPELDNAIILNEFTMIMENFGVPDIYDEEAAKEEEEDDDEYDDYVKDEDYLTDKKEGEDEEGDKNKENEEGEKAAQNNNNFIPEGKKLRVKPRRRKIILNFDELEPKGLKILRKLARFLLERYMHPREFYGPAIYRQMIKCKVKNSESHPVDILHAKDFYSRMKAAGVRKTQKEDENLTKFLRLDTKFPHLMQMKRVVKALEEVAQVEQKKMQEEFQKKAEAAEKDTIIEEKEGEDELDEDDIEGEESEEAEEEKKRNRRKKKKKSPAIIGPSAKANLDLMREAGIGGPGGFMNDYINGGGSSKDAKKLAMLMNNGGGGFSNLNTIEEEKHETQTSNYFRDAANVTESERDYDAAHVRGSKILDNSAGEDALAHSLIHNSSKMSPQRILEGENVFDFPGSTKNQQKSQQKAVSKSSGDRLQLSDKKLSLKNKKAADILVDDVINDDDNDDDYTPVKKNNKGREDHSNYENEDEDDMAMDDEDDDEDYEEEKNKMPSKNPLKSSVANQPHYDEEEEDNYEDDDEHIQENGKDQKLNKKNVNGVADGNINNQDEDSDYEF